MGTFHFIAMLGYQRVPNIPAPQVLKPSFSKNSSILFCTPCKVHRLHTCSVRSCRCQQIYHLWGWQTSMVNINLTLGEWLGNHHHCGMANKKTYHSPAEMVMTWACLDFPFEFPRGLALAGSAGAVAGTILGGAASVQWGVRRGAKNIRAKCLLIWKISDHS